MKQIDLRPFLADPELPRTIALSHESGLRTVLLHLKSGEKMAEHQTRGAITVQCLKGEVTFSAAEGEVKLEAGLLVSLAPACPHSLIAQHDSILLLTVSEQAARPS